MKKRYGLESIIGKKSTLRFPRLISVARAESLNFLLPANNAVSEPPFNTALTMKKGDPNEICDQFNDCSYDYDTDFPIRVGITIAGPSTILNITTPSIFSLINITFDIAPDSIESFRASIQDILLALINFALVKCNTGTNYLLSTLIGNIKSLYGNILSYNCRRRKDKNSKALLVKTRSQRFLKHKDNVYHSNIRSYQKKVYHFFDKTFRLNKRQLRSLLIERIDYFYDILDDWEDCYDLFDYDQVLDVTDYHLEVILLANTYSCVSLEQFYSIILSVSQYRQQAVLSVLQKEVLNKNRTDLSLIQTFN